MHTSTTPTLADFRREFWYFAPILEKGRRIEDVIPENMPESIRHRIIAETKAAGISIVHKDSGAWGVFTLNPAGLALYAMGHPDFVCDTEEEAIRYGQQSGHDGLILAAGGTVMLGTA
jgi:hypothetical protein